MDEKARLAVERALAWCGPLFVITFTYFWGILGHNIPPPNMMAMTPDQLVSEYYGRYPDISVGMIGAATVGLLYMAWSCQLASMLRDDKGSLGVLSLLELAGGLLTGWLLAFCSAIWAACSLLVGQVDPQTIKMVHTFTWLIFDCTYMITTIQMTGLGLYTILNKRQQIFPAWAGWTTIVIGLMFVALVFMPFVTAGPFALPGLWNFWIVFSSWLLGFFSVYSWFMLRHLYRNPEEARAREGRIAFGLG